MKSGAILATGIALSFWLLASGVDAAVVNTLPGSTAEVMPITQSVGAGPVTFGADNLTWTSSCDCSYSGYNAGYGFGTNGDWLGGDGMVGMNSDYGVMDIAFATPVAGVIADVNWAEVRVGLGSPITMTAYNAANAVVDTLVFDDGAGRNLVTPGQWGFQDTSADITRLEFSNGYLGARDFAITTVSAVPEPPTWALLCMSVISLGAAMRRARSRRLC